MSITPLLFFRGVIPTVEATVYTVPADLTVVVRHVLVTNLAGVLAVSVSVGGQRLFAAEQVAANKRLEQWLAEPLGPGAVISAVTGAANALILRVSGFAYA